jgi:acetyltransferase
MHADEGLGHDADLSPMDPPTTPPEYPEDLEQWIDLPDGNRIWVRPIVPEDVVRIEYAFAHADIDTIRRRFFTAAPPTDRAHLEYLANVDYVKRLALVAMDEEGNSVGIGRLEATEGSDAEIAIVVAPEWRRHGVASALLLALEGPARDRGIGRLVALYLPDNGAVEKLLLSIGYGQPRVSDGIAELTKDLHPDGQ